MNLEDLGLQVAVGGVTSPRIAAAGICADLRAGEMLDSSFERRTSDLDARDRRWLRELVYGMLRQRGAIDAILEARVRGGLARVDRDLVDLMRLGVYQLLHMGSVPAYAAIAQTVELAKVRHGIGASKLVNAVLRRLDRDFSNYRRYAVDIRDERIAVDGGTATVTCQVVRSFETKSGVTGSNTVASVFHLRRNGSIWTIERLESR